MNTRPLTKAGTVLAAAAALLLIGAPGAGANLSLNPSSHNFGSKALGTTTTQSFTLTATCDTVVANTCLLPVGGVHTTNLAVTGTGFSMGTTSCGSVLNATATSPASCTVNVNFAPGSAGAKTGSLTAGLAVTGNDIAAALSGTGVAAAANDDGAGGTQGAVGGKKKCKKGKKRAAAAKKKKCKRK